MPGLNPMGLCTDCVVCPYSSSNQLLEMAGGTPVVISGEGRCRV